MTIKKDCKWYSVKHYSIGDVDYCDLYAEELISDANDCDDSECQKFKLKGD